MAQYVIQWVHGMRAYATLQSAAPVPLTLLSCLKEKAVQ